MANVSDEMRRRIADAALTLFSRHGFQRTSIADVARAAKVSRGTVHLAFRDKTALFEYLAIQIVDDALAAAAAAWVQGGTLAGAIEATLLAKDLPLYRLLHASHHGAELLAVDAELTRHHHERLATEFAVQFAARIAAWPGIDLRPFGGAEGFGRFLAIAGAGLKHEAKTEEAYREAVHRLARVTASAAGAAADGNG